MMTYQITKRCLLIVSLMYGVSVGSFAVASELDHKQNLAVADGQLQISWQGEFTSGQREKTMTWLQQAAITTSLLGGQLPRELIPITLHIAPESAKPVAFGQVIRTENPGVQFWLNPSFPLEDFLSDWTAVHELVHLFIPYPGSRDVWLSEGLATYYQNILMARSGVLTEQSMWQKIYDGFERGRRDNGHSDYSLAEMSVAMRSLGSFMRVYWSGTAYFMTMDIALRRATEQRVTLDKVVAEYARCCQRGITTSGSMLVAEFDRLSGTDLFSKLYQEYRRTTGMPDTSALLDQLGIQVVNGQVLLAEPAALRTAIVQGRSE